MIKNLCQGTKRSRNKNTLRMTTSISGKALPIGALFAPSVIGANGTWLKVLNATICATGSVKGPQLLTSSSLVRTAIVLSEMVFGQLIIGWKDFFLSCHFSGNKTFNRLSLATPSVEGMLFLHKNRVFYISHVVPFLFLCKNTRPPPKSVWPFPIA